MDNQAQLSNGAHVATNTQNSLANILPGGLANPNDFYVQRDFDTLVKGVTKLLELGGYSLDDEGGHFKNTPIRWVQMMLKEFPGDEVDAESILGTTFTDGYKGIVVVKGIEFSSLCAHHLVPFYGRIHIGYLPNRSVVGISKFARLAEAYSHRITVQEVITRQICDAIDKVLDPRGVIVVVQAAHTCMIARGVRKTTTETVTSDVRGLFLINSAGCKDEFYAQISGSLR